MTKELSPVLLKKGIIAALEAGAILEVHCVGPVTRTSNVVKGEWNFMVKHTLGGEIHRQCLVNHELVPTAMTTPGGLVSMGMQLGATTINIPMVEGGIDVCKVPGSGYS